MSGRFCSVEITYMLVDASMLILLSWKSLVMLGRDSASAPNFPSMAAKEECTIWAVVSYQLH